MLRICVYLPFRGCNPVRPTSRKACPNARNWAYSTTFFFLLYAFPYANARVDQTQVAGKTNPSFLFFFFFSSFFFILSDIGRISVMPRPAIGLQLQKNHIIGRVQTLRTDVMLFALLPQSYRVVETERLVLHHMVRSLLHSQSRRNWISFFMARKETRQGNQEHKRRPA